MVADESTGLVRRIGLRSATALVVANIIGAGIFTSTGFQAADLGHAGLIYLLWIAGGILAVCGALCYAELGAAMPQAGGEYVYLRRTYGGAIAFMSAFVSLVAGFSAPIAAAAKSLVRYLTPFAGDWDPDGLVVPGTTSGDLVALGIVWSLVVLHSVAVERGLIASDWLTFFKVAGIIAFVLAAFAVGRGALSGLLSVSPVLAEARASGSLASAMATSLVFVLFGYSGWNAAAYVAGEIRDPQKNLPNALLLGTGIVVVLYLGLNATYFYAVGVDELAGRVEVGLVAARALFGPVGSTLVSGIISISILAAISAMTIAGPRVYYAFGLDFAPLRGLSRTARNGAPRGALVLQGVVTSLLILSGRVDQIQQYAGLTLTLFSSLAVSCVFVLRWREPDLERPFRVWGYPWTPLVFLASAAWIMVWAYRGRPLESTLSLLTVAIGGLAFYVLSRRSRS